MVGGGRDRNRERLFVLSSFFTVGGDRNREIKKYYCGKEKKKVKYMKGDDKMKRD
jgi:hypothetical protein